MRQRGGEKGGEHDKQRATRQEVRRKGESLERQEEMRKARGFKGSTDSDDER